MPGPHSFRQILSTNGRMPEVLLVPDMKLFAGNATPELAQRIANRLYTSLGDAAVGRFSDGEVSVQSTKMYAVVIFSSSSPLVPLLTTT
ncbi:ribose-phosphate pyrophosphokinase [Escherichia coli]|uniref:Ribose-phosphate pyrophosphokinase n=1 Tax=Escherichia coli TaxID=562 RepID=A0A376ZWI0_ECOLX|nr:ribose-phosphate pyrophosphokinase [Escherichia coli]